MCIRDRFGRQLVKYGGLLLLQKLRHLLKTDTVYIVGGVLAVLMKHNNVRNGKAMPLEIGGVVDIKLFPNVAQRHIFCKRRGIDEFIICPVNGMPRCCLLYTSGQDKGKSYAEYTAEKQGTSYKAKLKTAIDTLIPLSLIHIFLLVSRA